MILYKDINFIFLLKNAIYLNDILTIDDYLQFKTINKFV
jgi:hypothetical protein